MSQQTTLKLFNPYHDALGRFSSASGKGKSFVKKHRKKIAIGAATVGVTAVAAGAAYYLTQNEYNGDINGKLRSRMKIMKDCGFTKEEEEKVCGMTTMSAEAIKALGVKGQLPSKVVIYSHGNESIHALSKQLEYNHRINPLKSQQAAVMASVEFSGMFFQRSGEIGVFHSGTEKLRRAVNLSDHDYKTKEGQKRFMQGAETLVHEMVHARFRRWGEKYSTYYPFGAKDWDGKPKGGYIEEGMVASIEAMGVINVMNQVKGRPQNRIRDMFKNTHEGARQLKAVVSYPSGYQNNINDFMSAAYHAAAREGTTAGVMIERWVNSPPIIQQSQIRRAFSAVASQNAGTNVPY